MVATGREMAVGDEMFLRLFLLLIAVPLLELMLLARIGSRLGLTGTLGWMLLTGALGVWVARSQGLRVLRRVMDSLQQGHLPRQEVMEGLLILAAGVLLVAPGFLMDACGLILLISPCRAWAGRQLSGYLGQRFHVAGPAGTREAHGPGDEVIIEAEVIRTGQERIETGHGER